MPTIDLGKVQADEETTATIIAKLDGGSGKIGTSVIPPIPATTVTNTPSGSIAATTVQGAIDELAADLSVIKRYSVTKYGASGAGATQTTGGITSGTTALTVASTSSFAVGQGILIAGAGAAGVRLVASITTIVGNVITLSIAASTTVSGVAVKHDDSAAINAAIAAAYNAGGGEVYFPNGHYRCAAPLNAATNSVLTFPQLDVYHLTRRSVSITGENTGYMTAGYENIAQGGVALDFTDALTSGVNPSAIAAAPYVASPDFDGWNAVDVEIDRLMVVVAPGAMSGVNLHNCLRARVGDNLSVHVKATGAPVSLLVPLVADPTSTGSKGIDLPAELNNIVVNCGSASVSGFEFGIVSGEHVFFGRPSVIWCSVGLLIPNSSHLVSGSLSIENCPTVVKHIGTSSSVVNLELQVEHSNTTNWWRAVNGWLGNGWGFGTVTHSTYNKIDDNYPYAFLVTGAPNMRFASLREQHKETDWRNCRKFSLGKFEETAETNPTVLNLGGQYGSNAAGNTGNGKLVLYDSYDYGNCGLGVSVNGVEYYGFGGAKHTWYTSGGTPFVQVQRMLLSATGNLRPVAGVYCPTYANDAAADADTGLKAGEFYRLTASRAVFQKP
jgi:hypothetical protein